MLFTYLQCCVRLSTAVYPMINRRRFQQMEVLEGLNILVTISGRKNKLRVYYLSWLKTKILKTETVTDLLIMAALCSRCGHYILALWFLSIFFFLFLA